MARYPCEDLGLDTRRLGHCIDWDGPWHRILRIGAYGTYGTRVPYKKDGIETVIVQMGWALSAICGI